MSYFDNTNTFFNKAYRSIFDFACLPTRSIELVIPDRNKRISDYTGKQMASAAMMGIFVAFPLSCITFASALKVAVYTFILHAIAATFSLFLDAATDVSNRARGVHAC